ncbi:hypothetical protein T484DRAFT_1756156 [Baffinella frigidus]|nr:hypothetical protein T484DRAFT_1756156 [Cryptophyta sp. CCMP2293]
MSVVRQSRLRVERGKEHGSTVRTVRASLCGLRAEGRAGRGRVGGRCGAASRVSICACSDPRKWSREQPQRRKTRENEQAARHDKLGEILRRECGHRHTCMRPTGTLLAAPSARGVQRLAERRNEQIPRACRTEHGARQLRADRARTTVWFAREHAIWWAVH